jgi:hypothetical protein
MWALRGVASTRLGVSGRLPGADNPVVTLGEKTMKMKSHLITVGAAGLILALFPLESDAKTLKPKYYKSCYADYSQMREMVPKPSMDVQKTAKTVGTVAGIAGCFGGFGGGLGSMASTASTVAQYSESIADVAAFTESMTTSFPNASERYVAYGERMGTEAADMQKVADFSMASQECYAAAYTEVKAAVESGEMNSKEAKKRHSEITTGVANISEMRGPRGGLHGHQYFRLQPGPDPGNDRRGS